MVGPLLGMAKEGQGVGMASLLEILRTGERSSVVKGNYLAPTRVGFRV